MKISRERNLTRKFFFYVVFCLAKIPLFAFNHQELLQFPVLNCLPSNLDQIKYETVFSDDFNNINSDNWNIAIPSSNMQFAKGLLKLKHDSLNSNEIISRKKYKYGKLSCRFNALSSFFPSIKFEGSGEIQDAIIIKGNDLRKKGIQISGSFYNNTNGNDAYTHHINHSVLSKDAWHEMSIEWTPYKIVTVLNHQVVMELYRYYITCENGIIPIVSNSQKDSLESGSKYIENLAFPDDFMSIQMSFLAPAYTGTEDFLIDYIKFEQKPKGTWGDCEKKTFCAYTIYNYPEDTIAICSDENEIYPKDLTLYPAYGIPWSTFSFQHGDMEASLDKISGINKVNFTKFTDTEGWFSIEIPANANPSCIGQDRVLKRIIKNTFILNTSFYIGDKLFGDSKKLV